MADEDGAVSSGATARASGQADPDESIDAAYYIAMSEGDGAAALRTAAKDWARADFWFAHAVARAPSIPYAYAQWGRMLMAKGDLDGAIAKFASAHRKGPHFADPLEMWGEALIARNRSDLAVEKFEEAAKYAPTGSACARNGARRSAMPAARTKRDGNWRWRALYND
jgi:tetratricopeptide (TPR) repeat protein